MCVYYMHNQLFFLYNALGNLFLIAPPYSGHFIISRGCPLYRSFAVIYKYIYIYIVLNV